MAVVSTSSALRLLPLLLLLPVATVAASASIGYGVIGTRINQTGIKFNQTTSPTAERPLLQKSHRLLVYEYMPNGSLDRWIYCRHDNDSPPLYWSTRCKIIANIAKGLAYLHEECMKKIAHLDVKPQNILQIGEKVPVCAQINQRISPTAESPLPAPPVKMRSLSAIPYHSSSLLGVSLSQPQEPYPKFALRLLFKLTGGITNHNTKEQMAVVSTSSALHLRPLLLLLLFPIATITASTFHGSIAGGTTINRTVIGGATGYRPISPTAARPLPAPPAKVTPTAPSAQPAPTPKVIPTAPSALPAPIGTTSMEVKSSSVRRVVAILAPVVGFILLSILFLGTYFIRKRRTQRQYEMEMEEELGELQGTPMRFTFQQLKAATEQFADKLGEGGFGSVFKGQFGDERIGVKRLDRAEKSHRLLVYEYMPKGSLDKWIYCRHDNDSPPLYWSTRCKIITNIAKGLAYLHEECMKKIAHLDVKPQNILLDDDFNAKLSDFGLCKLIDRDMSQVFTRMRGTPGYLAPEWLTSQITEKADVYSFGVVVMEVISGRKNLDNSRSEESIHLITQLEEKVKTNRLVELIDNKSNDMLAHKKDVIEMMKLTMWWLQIDAKEGLKCLR
ncbi:G-type lectin S-receptor-like serine/threonine-protein kinase SD2-5 [Triticum urartu]|uniref:non-specific serine/threonine protein kinase n=1 Tax=Triticum urartu TaxID=4572 RepID=M7Z305_TRIUA|nr:G-type lectin S-receptor-like serine/threonine-protein kinase SD2-5 [Triticum urartu]